MLIYARPRAYSRNLAGSWTPAQISTFAWYDASDSSTISLSGSSVLQWNDKSGNGFHLTPPSSTQRPTLTTNGLNSKNVITFDGNTTGLMCNFASAQSPLPQVYAICKPTGAASRAAYGRLCSMTPSATSDAFSNTTCYTVTLNTPTSTTASIAAYLNGVFAANISFSSYSTPFLIVFEHSGTTVSSRVNGGSTTASGSNTYGTRSQNRMGLGGSFGSSSFADSSANSNGNWQGDIDELIILPAQASTTIRDKLEGYLAWKWGQQGNLPSGHAYKTAAPTV